MFNLLVSLFCYRSCIWWNNSDYALAGRQKFIPIMFFGKHDIHKSSVVIDMRICVEAPDLVKEHIKRNKSFDSSNDHTRQGLGSGI